MIQVHDHRSSRTKKDRAFPDRPRGASSTAEASEPDAEEQSMELAKTPSDVIDIEVHSETTAALRELQRSPRTPSSEFA